MAKKRLKRGKDWHAWAWKIGPPLKGDEGIYGFTPGELCHCAEPEKPKRNPPTESGKWVKVKFVEVK